MDASKVIPIVVLFMVVPIALAIAAISTYETTGAIDVTTGRTLVDNSLTNTDFTENTNSIPDNWDNSTVGMTVDTENAHTFIENGHVFIRWTDNGNNSGVDRAPDNENAWYYSDLVIGSLMDGLNSATTTFQWRLIENENMLGGTEVIIEALLGRPGGDNVTIYNTGENVISTAWTTIENSVSSYITGAGTYILYVRASATPDNTLGTSKITVGFDNVNLTVQIYGRGHLENTISDVETQTGSGFSIGALLPLVIAGISLITIIIVAFTKHGRRR